MEGALAVGCLCNILFHLLPLATWVRWHTKPQPARNTFSRGSNLGIPALPGIDENSINSQVRKEEREFYLIYTEDYIYKLWGLFCPLEVKAQLCTFLRQRIVRSKWHAIILHQVHQGNIIQVNSYQARSRSPWPPLELEKNYVLSRSYVASVRRKEKNNGSLQWSSPSLLGEGVVSV